MKNTGLFLKAAPHSTLWSFTALIPISKHSSVIFSSADTATPLADAIKMEKLIPDAGLVRFEGCGHYSFLDNPSGFARVLTSFLNS